MKIKHLTQFLLLLILVYSCKNSEYEEEETTIKKVIEINTKSLPDVSHYFSDVFDEIDSVSKSVSEKRKKRSS